MTRKLFITGLTVLFSLGMQAQTAYDALRFSQIFYTGTARSAAMGNAMTALGGDFGSLSINPAGSAVYPYTELIFTPALHATANNSDYLASGSSESRLRPGITNVGYVTSVRAAGFGLSFAVGYNGLNQYTDRFSATGVTNQSSWLASLAYETDGIFAQNMDWNDQQNPFRNGSAPWRSVLAWNTSLLDTLVGTGGMLYKAATEAESGYDIFIPGNLRQNFYRNVNGNVGEYLINMGVNIGNTLFMGANLGLQSIWYDYRETYSETAERPNDFAQTAFQGFTHHYRQTTSGVGVNLKFGVIFLPVDNLRLGAGISTPTWMRLHDEWQESMDAHFSDGYNPPEIKSPLGEYDYRINTPFRWNVGLAYTFGVYGALSVDYEQTAYDKTKMLPWERHAHQNPFSEENTTIRQGFQKAGNLRAGLELNPNEMFSLRGGYAWYQNPEKHHGSDTHIGSLGIGLRAGTFFSDLTFMQRFAQTENFSLYGNVYDGNQLIYQAPVGSQTSSNWKLLLSLGLRF
ncbi:MAG: hypothetical protein FWE30_08745 [Bacteroidales bacterium]|nr:hypothetical protein [Bacteroidales bacterium]